MEIVLQVTGVEIVVPLQYGGWQAKLLGILSSLFDSGARTFPADLMGQVLAAVNADEELKSLGQKAIKAVSVLYFSVLYGIKL